MGGSDNGCGSGLLGVTPNKLVPDRMAFTLQAHAALSGECNYYVVGTTQVHITYYIPAVTLCWLLVVTHTLTIYMPCSRCGLHQLYRFKDVNVRILLF